jgi:hypothetical protein
MRAQRVYQLLLFIIAFLLVLAASPVPAMAQLTVVSLSPSDGSTHIAADAVFEIVFSEPLDTTARYPWPEKFYLGLFLNPDTLTSDPDSVVITPDLKTVRVYGLDFQPDTRYVVGILGARSLTGDDLEMPAVATFTTAAALPGAAVSGVITCDNPTGTVVALFGEMFGEGNPEAAVVMQDASGVYTIPYIPPGTYFPVALKDVNKSGVFEPDSELDLAGMYDADSDGSPDSIVVAEGSIISDINITLQPFKTLTARERYTEVLARAQHWSADAAPVTIGAPSVSSLGRAQFWMYSFYSNERRQHIGYLVANIFISQFSNQDSKADTIPLPEQWLNSDIAADSAEFHGGKEFSVLHPDAAIMAFLGNMAGSNDSLTFKSGFVPKLMVLQKRIAKTNDLIKADAQPLPRPVWMFQYLSPDGGNAFAVILNGVSGKYITSFPPPPTTARFNLPAAVQAAHNWAADAELMFVGAHTGSISAAGTTDMWYFDFHSASLDSDYITIIANGSLVYQGLAGALSPSTIPLPPDWIDSDKAMLVAELHGGREYRMNNQDVLVSGGVARGVFFPQPGRAVWFFTYNSSTADPLNIYIASVTGEYLEPQILDFTTARFNLIAANQSAKEWADDAQLIMVGSHQEFQDLDPNTGRALMWFFIYQSAVLNDKRVFFMSNGNLIDFKPPDWQPPSQTPLPKLWIDSDEAVQTAEVNGGKEYRNINQDVWLYAAVSYGFVPNAANSLVWSVTYFSGTADPLTLWIDALTGNIYGTSVNEKPANGLPQNYNLEQNYPNPFNAETVFRYQIPKSAEVEISVFNIQGQKVACLTQAPHQAGVYQVKWDGRDDRGVAMPGGVYVCHMRSGSFTLTKKMLLLR